MQTAIDPFHPVLRVIDRYRQDVHELHPPTAASAIAAVGGHLGQPVPASLAAFLERWDGATLFRGALRVRSLAQLAPASKESPSVILFADGPTDRVRWAFAPDGAGDAIFGRWHEQDDGSGQFEPLHERFDRWLISTVRILDENVRDASARLNMRLDCDPDCGFLLLAQAERLLGEGLMEPALTVLRRATAADPGFVPTWERLGDTLRERDPQAARFAWLKALRAVRLPAPYPSVHAIRPTLIHSLARMFPKGDDGWERELVMFLDEAVRDARDPSELELAETAALALGRVRLDRGERQDARKALVSFLDRARGFHSAGPCAQAVLMLAGLEADLGHHDDAERRLRALRSLPAPTSARALLVLGRIAVMRQEPWAEEILCEALEGLAGSAGRAEAGSPGERCDALLLLGERSLLQERWETAAELFGEAMGLATGLADREPAARAAMGLGDLARNRGDAAAAGDWYQRARAESTDGTELLERVLVRRGDLFRLSGDLDAAARDYARAADGFAQHGLPLREAWARLRLAQVGVKDAAESALAIFKSADLAAGVAAADAISGEPSRNLPWHLERAADHARDRANAQRARPPLTRADAERPERRIGAHRSAVAACDVRVVETLATHLDYCARTLDLATPRHTDPNLARYVAATDLLAAHRSYEAAEVLMRHLLEIRPGGLAGRALVGAMARSPNAALVAGLLDALEGGFEPSGMAAAAEVLGWRREPEAVPTLLRLIGPETRPTVRKAAVVALGRIGSPDAIDHLLDLLEVDDLAEETSTALLLLGEWRGVDAQAQAQASQRPDISRSLGEIVGRYGGPAYLLLLFRSVDLEGTAGVGALQGLGYLGDPRAVPRLIDAVASRDPNRAKVASGALEILTGHHENPEESLLRSRWSDWWEAHHDAFELGNRYRNGHLLDPSQLISRMSHDDPSVRRSTYDELVISTGQRLPFDAEGPYRVQVAHQSGWQRWWHANSHDYPPGRWTFHGEEIG